ncbi:MAG: XisI protein [Anaerolineae bacterium]|nr:XisI protein [Anaerolineae bacterium]
MASLKDTLLQVLQGYTGEALNGSSILTISPDETLFTVVSIGQVRDQRIVDTGLVVRCDGETIIIEHDANDKLLVEALEQAGIPRTQIILAYQGESAPKSVA